LTRIDYSTEQFAGFLANWQESFWGDLQGQTQEAPKTMLEVDSEQRMEEYLGLRWYERPAPDAAGNGDLWNGRSR
jgi:hypothetical protein